MSTSHRKYRQRYIHRHVQVYPVLFSMQDVPLLSNNRFPGHCLRQLASSTLAPETAFPVADNNTDFSPYDRPAPRARNACIHGFRTLTGNWNDNLLNFIIFIFHKEHIRHRTALTNLRWVAFQGQVFHTSAARCPRCCQPPVRRNLN